MKTTLKAILALSLSLLLLVSCGAPAAVQPDDASPGTTEAEKPTPEDQFTFEAGEGGLIVTKYTGSAKKVIIPSIVENKKVVSLNADVFGGNIILEEIVLSEHMTYVDLDDFGGCDNLTSVTYPAKEIEGRDSLYLESLVEIHFPNAKSFPLDLLTVLYYKNDNLRTFDLRSLEDLETVKDLTDHSKDDLTLILSDTLMESVKGSVAAGYLYEELNYTVAVYEQYCNDSACTKNHSPYDGDRYHVACRIDPGVDLYMEDNSHIDLERMSTYVLDAEAVSFEEGLKSSIPFPIHTRSYGKYDEFSASEDARFWNEEVLNACAKAAFGDGAVASGIKFTSTTTENGTADYIQLCTVTVGDSVFECVFGHEFDYSRSAFLARRLVGNTSDVNVAVTYALGCNSVTVNGTTYTANTWTPSFYGSYNY